MQEPKQEPVLAPAVGGLGVIAVLQAVHAAPVVVEHVLLREIIVMVIFQNAAVLVGKI